MIAAGADSVDDVALAVETLGDSDTFQAAEDDLGDGLTPSFFVNFAPIFDLIDSTGETDADVEAARPYLNALDYLIGGSKVDDDRSVAGFTLGVQDQPEGDLDVLGDDHPVTPIPGVRRRDRPDRDRAGRARPGAPPAPRGAAVHAATSSPTPRARPVPAATWRRASRPRRR